MRSRLGWRSTPRPIPQSTRRRAMPRRPINHDGPAMPAMSWTATPIREGRLRRWTKRNHAIRGCRERSRPPAQSQRRNTQRSRSRLPRCVFVSRQGLRQVGRRAPGISGQQVQGSGTHPRSATRPLRQRPVSACLSNKCARSFPSDGGRQKGIVVVAGHCRICSGLESGVSNQSLRNSRLPWSPANPAMRVNNIRWASCSVRR
jgi:hypothetical protein